MLSKWTADQTELVDSIKYNYYDHWYNIYTSQHCNDAVLRNQREENVKQVLVKVSNHETSYTGVGGKSVRQADVSGGTHFPRKPCPTGQDILSVLG